MVGEYTYNALGQRVARTASYRGRIHAHFDKGNDESNEDDGAVDSLHVTTDKKKVTETLHYQYDQLGNLIVKSDEQGSAQPDTSQPLALHYIHNDHLGTANKVTDSEQ